MAQSQCAWSLDRLFTMERVTIGQRVKRVRQRRGMTQRELARRSGLSPMYISRLERDHFKRPRKITIHQLRLALKDDLVDSAPHP